MFRFQDRVFLQRDAQWYVWEPTWDSMRPIDGFAWTGRRYEIQDTSFTTDPFSETFGYGSLKQTAHALSDECLDHVESAPAVPFACIGTPVWAGDRFLVTTAPDTWRAHHAAFNLRRRTLRSAPRGKRVTKRVLPSDKTCVSTSS
jgi:hypothetical protein